ncbi:exported hypothetical protein [Cupriavidus phytorum]|uniref:Uncharacterized protein n=1 Tax=Cupriavidus taiwanensis TaxID=164546 RepID=A0A375CLP5_9BURK|nr:exported hypothetical protein [Cupriavidus taiwanensis]
MPRYTTATAARLHSAAPGAHGAPAKGRDVRETTDSQWQVSRRPDGARRHPPARRRWPPSCARRC